MNQRIERLIASAVARQISGVLSENQREALTDAIQKRDDAEATLRRFVADIVDDCFQQRRPAVRLANAQF